MWAASLQQAVPDDVQEVVRVALLEMRRSRDAYRSMKQRIASSTPKRQELGGGRGRGGKGTRQLAVQTEEYSKVTNRERSRRTGGKSSDAAAMSRCRELESIYLDTTRRHFFGEALLLDWLAIVPFLSSMDIGYLLRDETTARGAQMATCYVYFVGFHDRYVEDQVLSLIQENKHARRMVNRRFIEDGAAWRATSRGSPPTLGEVAQLLQRKEL
jgi:hypothetical protein